MQFYHQFFEESMTFNLFIWSSYLIWLYQRINHWTKPTSLSLASGIGSDLTRSRINLIIENAILRQQLIVFNRQVKRPQLTPRDRFRLVLLASCTRFWKQALHIVQPDTLLHRELFRFYWRVKSKSKQHKPKISSEADRARLIGIYREEVPENLEQQCQLAGTHRTEIMRFFNVNFPLVVFSGREEEKRYFLSEAGVFAVV